MTLTDLIQKAVSLKQGDTDFALFFHHGGGWTAMIGNTCKYVLIGESDPEFSAHGDTAEQAVQDLITKLGK